MNNKASYENTVLELIQYKDWQELNEAEKTFVSSQMTEEAYADMRLTYKNIKLTEQQFSVVPEVILSVKNAAISKLGVKNSP